MDEAVWRKCSEPNPLFSLITAERRTHRIHRLITCGFCRGLWHLVTHKHSRSAVETAERFADGLALEEELKVAFRRAWAVHEAVDPENVQERNLATQTVWAAAMTAHWLAIGVSNAAMEATRIAANRGGAAMVQEKEKICNLLRCIGGNPFRPVKLDCPSRTPTVVHLAQSMYDDRTFDDLPILADALEDAGCHQQELLDHLRGRGSHVLGCWALDLVLNKK
jgi:hypothetical protein